MDEGAVKEFCVRVICDAFDFTNVIVFGRCHSNDKLTKLERVFEWGDSRGDKRIWCSGVKSRAYGT